MNPKDKATELINTYNSIIPLTAPMHLKENARRCALVSVNEVLTELSRIEDFYEDNFLGWTKEYWEGVKKEIENYRWSAEEYTGIRATY